MTTHRLASIRTAIVSAVLFTLFETIVYTLLSGIKDGAFDPSSIKHEMQLALGNRLVLFQPLIQLPVLVFLYYTQTITSFLKSIGLLVVAFLPFCLLVIYFLAGIRSLDDLRMVFASIYTATLTSIAVYTLSCSLTWLLHTELTKRSDR